MRTAVILDEDVAADLQAEVRCSGLSFEQVLNDTLRCGLNAKHSAPKVERFRVNARDLGRVMPGLNLDNLGVLLEAVESPLSR